MLYTYTRSMLFLILMLAAKLHSRSYIVVRHGHKGVLAYNADS